MAEQKDRAVWSAKHIRDIFWLKQLSAATLVLLGMVITIVAAVYSIGFLEYFGTGIVAIGVFVFFPSARPMLSRVATRLPFLSNSTDKDPQ